MVGVVDDGLFAGRRGQVDEALLAGLLSGVDVVYIAVDPHPVAELSFANKGIAGVFFVVESVHISFAGAVCGTCAAPVQPLAILRPADRLREALGPVGRLPEVFLALRPLRIELDMH